MTRSLNLILPAWLACCSMAPAATVIYQDDFNFTGSLNGHTPTTTTGGANWTTSLAWTADGSTMTAASGLKTAYLPFSPVDGNIYELSVKMASTGTAATTWTSIGFGGTDPLVAGNFTDAAPNQGLGTMILRENGNYQGYTTGATSAVAGTAITGFTAATYYDFKLVLNTAGTNWVTEYYVNNTKVGTRAWSTGDPAIGSVQLTTTSTSSNARYDDFQLTVQPVPEASSIALCGLAGSLVLVRRRRD